MEIDIVQLSSELAEEIMKNKYGKNWLNTKTLKRELFITKQYNKIKDHVFLCLLMHFPQNLN